VRKLQLILLSVIAVVPAIAQTPVVTAALENYGQRSALLPGSGIAPSAIFFVKGTNLADTTNTRPLEGNYPLEDSLNGVSITVTSGGKAVKPYLYYITPGQLAGVMPAETNLGAATLVVANNGRSSAPFNITVVRSSFGMLTLNGSGGGIVGARNGDQNYALITETNAPNRGEIIYFYGSGLRKFVGDERNLNTVGQDYTDVNVVVLLGGVPGEVLYRGATAFPGLNQIAVRLPPNTPVGCAVSVLITADGVPSNMGTLPVAATGRACPPDLATVNTGATVLGTGARVGAVVSGVTYVTAHANQGGGLTNFTSANASFVTYPQGISTLGVSPTVLNSCISIAGGISPNFTTLDAGTTIGITSAGGSGVLSKFNGLYASANVLGPVVPQNGGPITFNIPGGADVGPATVVTQALNGFQWTNVGSVSGVTRSQDLILTWNNAPAEGFVLMYVTSIPTPGFSPQVICLAPAEAKTFTIPAAYLATLPASVPNNSGTSGSSVLVAAYSKYITFNAKGIDIGYGYATWGHLKQLEVK
jgi:uncharacterized protein (TIGR03437 family)